MDSAFLSVLTGSGVAGVFCILFVLGWVFPRQVVQDLREQIRELKAALLSERDRADAAVAAANATKDVLVAIQYGRAQPQLPEARESV